MPPDAPSNTVDSIHASSDAVSATHPPPGVPAKEPVTSRRRTGLRWWLRVGRPAADRSAARAGSPPRAPRTRSPRRRAALRPRQLDWQRRVLGRHPAGGPRCRRRDRPRFRCRERVRDGTGDDVPGRLRVLLALREVAPAPAARGRGQPLQPPHRGLGVRCSAAAVRSHGAQHLRRVPAVGPDRGFLSWSWSCRDSFRSSEPASGWPATSRAPTGESRLRPSSSDWPWAWPSTASCRVPCCSPEQSRARRLPSRAAPVPGSLPPAHRHLRRSAPPPASRPARR